MIKADLELLTGQRAIGYARKRKSLTYGASVCDVINSTWDAGSTIRYKYKYIYGFGLKQ